MRFLSQLAAVLFACGLLTSAHAQPPNLDPGVHGNQQIPTVTFEWASSGVVPAYYAITVDSMGDAAYHSDEMEPDGIMKTQLGMPYLVEFTISAATTARIFALAQQADYFNANFEDASHRDRTRAIKTLTYGEGPRIWFGHLTSGVHYVTTYDYTDNATVQQLTTIFEELSTTVQLGRRLNYLRGIDSAELSVTLRRAAALGRQRRLPELQIIAKSLQSISEDSALPPATRQQAVDLLALAHAS